MDSADNKFSPDRYYDLHGSNITSDNINKQKGRQHIGNCRKELYEYLLAKPETSSVALILAGPGTGKSTLLQHLPELKTLFDDPSSIIDENSLRPDSEYDPIRRALDSEKTDVKIYSIVCPVKDAAVRMVERSELKKESAYSLNYFAENHNGKLLDFIRSYAVYRNDPRVSFILLTNPKSSREQSEASVSLDDIKQFTGEDAYVYAMKQMQNKNTIIEEASKSLDELCLRRAGEGKPLDVRALPHNFNPNRIPGGVMRMDGQGRA